MKKIKGKIFTTIVFVLTVFIFVDKVDAAHMWIQCNDYEPKYGNADYRVYNTFAVFNDKYNEARLIAFVNENNLLEFVNASVPLYKQGPTLMATQDDYLSGKECWMITDDTSKDCWDIGVSELNPISTMMIDGYCPVYVEKSGDVVSDTSRFIKLWGKTTPRETLKFNKSQFIIYEFTTEGNTYIVAEGYDANTGEYSYFRDNPTEMFFYTDVKSLSKSKNEILGDTGATILDVLTGGIFGGIFGTIGGDTIIDSAIDTSVGVFQILPSSSGSGLAYYYDSDYMGWAGATQIARMVNCVEYFGTHDYFNLSSQNYCSLLASLGGDHSEESVNFKFLYDSSDTSGNFDKFVNEWYTDNYEEVNKITSKLDSIDGSAGKLKEVADGINDALSSGKKYVFDSHYSISEAIYELEIAYESILELNNVDDIKFSTYDESCNAGETVSGAGALETAINSTFYCKTFKKQLDDLVGVNFKTSTGDGINVAVYISLKLQDILKKYAHNGSNIDFFGLEETLKDYTVSYARASLYLYSNRSNYAINSVDLDRLRKLKENFSNLSADFGINTIVVDCESLIGTKLLNQINSYLDIIKIAIPILVIGMGTMDFLKAMFSNNEENMRKAQMDFLKRIAIAILIFLSPTFINLLLSVANKVWYFINPNSCGIFQ